ncbi:MAG TPA: hypothetical protein VHP37_05625 [Burkholderiales bacterium]|nr:hypothetical protein [Burkholderiales bacterium]
MAMCRIVPVQGPTKAAFSWEWRSERSARRSKGTFGLFYECVEDARRHGFEVLLDQPTGANAPARYSLDAPSDSIGRDGADGAV